MKDGIAKIVDAAIMTAHMRGIMSSIRVTSVPVTVAMKHPQPHHRDESDKANEKKDFKDHYQAILTVRVREYQANARNESSVHRIG